MTGRDSPGQEDWEDSGWVLRVVADVLFHESAFYEPFDFLCSLVMGQVKNLLIPNKQVFLVCLLLFLTFRQMLKYMGDIV